MGKYAAYGRELHTLPHRDNLDTNDSLLFYQNEEYKQLELNKIRALQAGIELNVTAPEGSVISVSNGTETFSKTGGTVQFTLDGVGTYTVSATKDGRTASETLVVDSIRVYNVTLEYYHIYGIQRDQNSSSPEWTRTDEAVGKTATASVGNVTIGHSDFDNCYPWSEMKRVTMSTGDVMVYIPEFYYKRVVDSNGIETIQIADRATAGFSKHPGSDTYVGAYQMGSGYCSKTNTSIASTQTLASFRSGSNNKGSGWGVWSLMQLLAIRMLYLVEYANYDSQTTIGLGICNSSWSYVTTTGTTDSVSGLTGSINPNSYSCDVVYRGIETLWGNFGAKLDGGFISEGDYYIGENPSEFSNSGSTYIKASYKIDHNDTSYNYYYIVKMGYDPNMPWLMMPESTSGGSSTTYCCDAISVITSDKRCIETICVGRETKGGIFALCGNDLLESHQSGALSSRLAYYPSLDPENTTTVTGEWTYSN